jgi:hypothetical protein|tara:strand:+ start:4981 stop:5883 length:903 start_codon:yes stop_codon:yes gene_type:complete
MGFNDMKKKAQGGFDKLTSEMNKLTTKSSDSYKDDRFWKPELDKSSNGYAVIRFLPACDGEDIPWARLFTHGFKGPGGWYIENSRTTLGEKDPVSEMNTLLWNSGQDSDKDIARNRKRRLSYISNILVVSDPANPQNEGKIFLYKYGKKIFDKVNEAMNPEFADETPVNPFDFWEGANFKLKVRKVAGFINYDKSEFESASKVYDGDDTKLEELWKTQYALTEFTDASNFKSYDELRTKLHKVVGSDIRSSGEDFARAEQVTSPPKSDVSSSSAAEAPVVEEDGESGDALSYFEKLANEG